MSPLLKFVLVADFTNMPYSENAGVTNCELDKLYTWFTVKKLSLNVSNTNYMIFTKCKLNCDLEIKIHNNQIARVSKITFLGVVIDEKFDSKNHRNCV